MSYDCRHRPRRFGFTLIELLVVVAIIALLISILLPSLSRARETSRMVKCLAIQKQMGVTNIMYADEQNQWYVDLRRNKNGVNAIGGGFWGANIRFRQILGLPVVPNSGTTPGTGQRGIPDLICPNKQPSTFIERGEWYRAFAFSGMGSPGIRGNGSVWGDGIVYRAKVRGPSGKVMGMDAVNWYLTWSGEARKTNFWDLHGDTHQSGVRDRYVAFRHLENTSALYHDGHAESVSADDAWRSSSTFIIRMYDPYKN